MAKYDEPHAFFSKQRLIDGSFSLDVLSSLLSRFGGEFIASTYGEILQIVLQVPHYDNFDAFNCDFDYVYSA